MNGHHEQLYDAIKELAFAFGLRADPKRIELYVRGMEDLDPACAVDAASQARNHFDRFPSIKQLRGFYGILRADMRSEQSGHGYFPISARKVHGTPPWTYHVPPGGAFCKLSRDMDGHEFEEWFEGDPAGAMTKVAERVQDDLGFWMLIPIGRRPQDHPRWNKGVPKWEGRSVSELVKALNRRLGEIGVYR